MTPGFFMGDTRFFVSHFEETNQITVFVTSMIIVHCCTFAKAGSVMRSRLHCAWGAVDRGDFFARQQIAGNGAASQRGVALRRGFWRRWCCFKTELELWVNEFGALEFGAGGKFYTRARAYEIGTLEFGGKVCAHAHDAYRQYSTSKYIQD